MVCTEPIASGESLVRLPNAAAVSVDDAEEPEELKEWWQRHSRSSIRLAAKLVLQRAA